MTICTLTVLAMINWKKVESDLEKEVLNGTKPKAQLEKFKSLKIELDAAMNEGETYFSGDKEEVDLLTDLMGYVLKKGR